MRILIAGVSVRAAAETALRAGYDVETVDYFGDRDLAAICPARSLRRDFDLPISAEGLAQAAAAIPADAVAYTSSFENHPDLIDRLAAGRRLLGNTAETVRRVRDFAAVADCLRTVDVCTPQTIGPDDLPPSTAQRWLQKPVRSGGGHGIRRWTGGTVEPGHVLQAEVEGLAASATFVSDGEGCRVLALSEQIIGQSAFGASGYRYCGSLMPLAAATPAVVDQVERACAALARAFGLRGLNGLDFVLAGDRIWVVEVNPRFSASMELIDLLDPTALVYRQHVEACGNADPHPRPLSRVRERGDEEGAFAGKAILFADRVATLASTDGWIERGLRDVPWSGESFRPGQPICTILVTAGSREDCLAALHREAAALKKVIYGDSVHPGDGPLDEAGNRRDRR